MRFIKEISIILTQPLVHINLPTCHQCHQYKKVLNVSDVLPMSWLVRSYHLPSVSRQILQFTKAVTLESHQFNIVLYTHKMFESYLKVFNGYKSWSSLSPPLLYIEVLSFKSTCYIYFKIYRVITYIWLMLCQIRSRDSIDNLKKWEKIQ